MMGGAGEMSRRGAKIKGVALAIALSALATVQAQQSFDMSVNLQYQAETFLSFDSFYSLTNSHHHHRRLAAWNSSICPDKVKNRTPAYQGEIAKATSSGIPVDNAATQGISEATDLISSQSLDTLKNLRGMTDNEYNSSLQNFYIILCENAQYKDKTTYDRCVEPSESLAVKDSNGTCIKLTESTACSKTQIAKPCEAKENCFWKPVVPGMARGKKYEKAQADNVQSVFLIDYVKGLAYFAVPGIALAVLCLLSFFLFCLLRCCCNLCWGRDPKIEGYTKCEKLLPAIFFLIFTLGIVILAIFVFLSNNTITNSIEDIKSATDMLFTNLDVFSQRVKNPIKDMSKSINQTFDGIGSQLAGATWISSEYTGLTTDLSQFKTRFVQDRKYPASCTSNCIPCVFCAGLNSSLDTSIKAMSDKQSEINNIVTSLQNTIVNQRSSVQNTIDSALAQFDGLTSAGSEGKVQIKDAFKTVDSTTTFRLIGVLVLFALGLVSSVTGWLGILAGCCSRKSCIIHFLHITWISATFILFISFIVASIMLIAAVVWSDGCMYLNIVSANFVPAVGPDMGAILNACFHNEYLLETLGLSKQLSFADSYSPASFDASQIQNAFKPLHDQNLGMQNKTLEDLGYSSTTYIQYQTEANTAATVHTPSGPFDDTSMLQPWSLFSSAPYNAVQASAYAWASSLPPADAELSAKFQRLFTYRQGFLELNQTLTDMKTNFSAIDTHTAAYETNCSTLASSIVNDPGFMNALDNIDIVKCELQCSWIKTTYDSIYKSMCQSLLSSFLTISLCIFVMALFLIAIVILAVVLHKRLRGYRKGSEQARRAMEMKAKEELNA